MASESNYTNLQSAGATVANEWPDAVPAIQAMLAVWYSKVRVGAEPTDELAGWMFSDGTLKYAWMLKTSGSDLIFQENIGDDITPNWQTRLTISATTGVQLAASAIISGQFDEARISQLAVTQHEGAIDHDLTNGGGGNRHIDHSTVTIGTAGGSGLSGGGDLTATRNLALTNTGVTPGSYTLASITVDNKGRISAASSGSAAYYKPYTQANLNTGDVVGIAAVETDVGALTGQALPEAGNGVKVFEITGTIGIYKYTNQGQAILRGYFGANGGSADGAPGLIRVIRSHRIQNNNTTWVHIPPGAMQFVPAAGNLWGVSVQLAITNGDIKGTIGTREYSSLKCERIA